MQTKTVGQRIKYLRKQSGITQKKLANILYVSDKTVSSWETDRTEPDITSIIKISVLLQVSLEYLLIGENKKTL